LDPDLTFYRASWIQIHGSDLTFKKFLIQLRIWRKYLCVLKTFLINHSKTVQNIFVKKLIFSVI
jgi:hypothetical protein